MRGYTIGNQTGIDSLKLIDIDEPICKNNEVIIKFHAHSLNYRDYIGDWKMTIWMIYIIYNLYIFH